MKKSELEAAIAKKLECSERKAKVIVDTVFGTIADTLKKEEVAITGFGTFEKRKRKKKKTRDISTGKMIVVPAHNGVNFRMGESLRRSVNK